MVTDENIQTFLEHHGIKGMHWGVRRNKETGTEQRSKGGLSTGDKAAMGLAVGIGVLAVGALLARHNHVKINNLPKTPLNADIRNALKRSVHPSNTPDFLKPGHVHRINGAIPLSSGGRLTDAGRVHFTNSMRRFIRDTPKNTKLSPNQAARYHSIIASMRPRPSDASLGIRSLGRG